MLPYRTVLKWNPNQPRNPKGSAAGGQFATVRGGGSGEGPTHVGRVPGAYGKHVPLPHEAGYATIMGAPMGTGFANRPRANFTLPKPQMREAAPASAVRVALTDAGVDEVIKPLNDGVNVSLLVRMGDEQKTKAVYKPEAGEMWGTGFTNGEIEDCITNKDFSLAEREAMASEVNNALGLGLVPETVLRPSVGVDVDASRSDNEVIYDSYELREMYNEYREKAQDDAMEAVGGEMADLYGEAQDQHVKDIERRAEEMADIWNEEAQDFPDEGPYGAAEILRGHPKLPLGSAGSFQRQEPQEKALNPLEVLDEAKVDVAAGMTSDEKDRVRAIIRQRLEEGYQELGDVDRDAARDHLEYDKFIEEHADTEARLYESKIKTLTRWAEDMGYNQASGGGGGGAQNDDAPHPNGGSLQHFVEGLDDYGTLSKEDGAKLAVLDYAIGSMDRHGGNIKFVSLGDVELNNIDRYQVVAIDNGYSMPAPKDPDEPDDFTFRSVPVRNWMAVYGSQGMTDAEREPILKALQETNWQALVDRHPSMSSEERQAFLGRIEVLKDALDTNFGLYRLWKRQDLM